MQNDELTQRILSDSELTTLLRSATRDTNTADNFFGRFSYLTELSAGRYSSALDQGVALLLKCQSLDNAAYTSIHKGTPFYWLGTAAFLLHDYQTAVFFYDAAVSEDLRAGAEPITSPSPSLHFIQIDGEQPNQAAQSLVQLAQARIEKGINEYNNILGRPSHVANLTVPMLRDKFLRPAISLGHERWRSLATAFISFFLEEDHNNTLLDLRIGGGTAEPFFIHLFKGCMLFESLLKANPKQPIPSNATQLGQVLQHLHVSLGIPHDIKTGQADLPSIVRDLPSTDNNVQTAIEYAGRIRNSIGHDLGWVVRLDKIQYNRLFQVVATACLHTIACLY